MISLNGAEGPRLNVLLSVCGSCVAVWEKCLLAGVILWLQGPGATGNWVHALLTSGVRMVTAFHREIGTVSIRESPWLIEPTS